MNTEKIIKTLEEKIENISETIEIGTYGIVQSVSSGIVKISGLRDCMSQEMLSFENGQTGIAQNLEQDTVGAIVLSNQDGIKEGDKVTKTGRILSVPVGDDCLGRVVDPQMNPLDGKSPLQGEKMMPIDNLAPGVMTREPVTEPLQTGILAIDALIPVGRGQRELIIGDRGTGKTAIAIDTILNQKNENTICIYVAIGQKKSKVMRLITELEKHGAMKYTTVVLASSSDAPSLLYLAPYTGISIAEYFMNQGKDVLVVYDDLSKHAVAYREISLLLRRPPGREAYPGDVFYLHSRLLERACRRNKEHGGGSITALPIIETQGGDISAYIPTNVISITDGQIFLESGLFYKGIRPAINIGSSVSRVGGSAQIKGMKKNAGSLKLYLAQYRELESFSQFDSDLDEDTKKTLERGKRLVEILKQPQYSPLQVGEQISIIYASNKGFIDKVPVAKINSWKNNFLSFLNGAKSTLLQNLSKEWTEDTEKMLKDAINEFEKTQTE